MRKTMIMLSALAGLAVTATMAFAEMVDGEVTRVDAGAGKITIKHGPVKKFDMEGDMTMVFRANDPAMLKEVKPGDKIRFDMEKVNGQFTVMKLEKRK